MGSLYKRSKTWYIDYRVNGKRVRKRIGPSKKVAELALKEVEVKRSKGEIGIVERKKRIDEYIEEFSQFVKINKKYRTTQRYLEVIAHF